MKTELNSQEKKNGTEINLISRQRIQNMIDHYRKNQLKHINDNLMIDDAHSIWFDLPTLKNFIKNIEIAAQIKDPDISDKDLGIRFYYAAYPDAGEDKQIPEDYVNRHTLVMIPTKMRTDNNGELLNFDFNPLDSDSHSGNSSAAMALTSKNEVSAMAQNHGNLIPPTTTIAESY